MGKHEIEAVRARRHRRPPVVMTKDEVRRVLAEMGDGHLLMAKLLYGCGLRLMECIRLRVKDLDFEGRMIYIRAGKGDKDRVTVFPNNLMEDLHDQVEVVRTGIVRRHHVLESGLQKAVKTAAARAGITKRVGCHTFRHCFATHMLENGVNIRVVQELMGHANVKTTEIYTHVMEKDIRGVLSPLDAMMEVGKEG